MRAKFLRYRSWYQIDFQASQEPWLGLALALLNYHAMYVRHVSHVNLVSSNDGLAHHRVSVARWLSFENFVTIWNSNFYNKISTCVSVCVVFLFFGCYRETCCDTVSRVYCVCVLRINAYVHCLKSSVVVFLMPAKLCAFKVNVFFIVSFFLSFRSLICIFYLC